jgi:long-chain acyl-CoA synthetase
MGTKSVDTTFDLLKKHYFRQWIVKNLSSMGLANLIKSVYRARKLNRGWNQSLPRYMFPELWKGLGARKAVISSTGEVSFEQLADRAVRLSNRFHRLGITRRDRVAVLLNNEQGWFDVMSACTFSGIKMPMLNYHLKADELVKCINNCAPKVLVFSPEYLGTIKHIEEALESVEYFVCSGDQPVIDSQRLPEHYLTLETLIANGDPWLEEGGFGIAQMCFSGGSTGVPKFIVEKRIDKGCNPRMKGVTRHDMTRMVDRLIYGIARTGMGGVKGQIVSLVPGPLYHGGVQAAVNPIYIGGTIVPMLTFDAENFLQLVERHKVNYTFVAPTMLERILKLPDEVKVKYDLSSMQEILCSAAPCADYVKQGINALFKRQGASRNVFYEYYGSAEAFVISVLRPEDYEEKPERYKSVGKVCGCDCMVYNVDEKRACKPFEEGHVIVRNPRIYTVNYGNSNEMDDGFIEVDGAYWFDDGCLGYFDDDGFLYLTSRSKDMIISGGVNIFPVEIEEVIKLHANILDAVVIKVPDSDLGEVPGALIQTVNGDVLSDQEIVEHCKQGGLYGFKMPRHIRFIDELPRTTAGKIRKKDLEKVFLSPDSETMLEAS